MGGKEVHGAIMGKIQGLAQEFSSYQDESLMKWEELLQYAQGAITGLKMSTNLARIDMEVSSFRTNFNLTEIQSLSTEANGKIYGELEKELAAKIGKLER
ncbi:hypothetical protein Nepgr_028968 [Nepenthes gracilis]|uniref:Uncharacterized protein n=1 Tax=Nepenthes gracilis TaxID=150966 RepID=A0AAD3TBI1_NEPGR|nr:hypothetical protein Nepgr_028968 [Nepenthes gracilis]